MEWNYDKSISVLYNNYHPEELENALLELREYFSSFTSYTEKIVIGINAGFWMELLQLIPLMKQKPSVYFEIYIISESDLGNRNNFMNSALKHYVKKFVTQSLIRSGCFTQVHIVNSWNCGKSFDIIMNIETGRKKSPQLPYKNKPIILSLKQEIYSSLTRDFLNQERESVLLERIPDQEVSFEIFKV